MLQHYSQDWQGCPLYRDSHVLLGHGRCDYGVNCLHDDWLSLAVSLRSWLFGLHRAKWYYRPVMSNDGPTAQLMADDPELDAFVDTIDAGEFLRKKRLANHILKRIDNQLHMINK